MTKKTKRAPQKEERARPKKAEPAAATQGGATVRGCYPPEHTFERMILAQRNSERDEQDPAAHKEGEEP